MNSLIRTAFCFLVAAVVFGTGIATSHSQEKSNPFANNILGTLANKEMAADLELLDEQQEHIDRLMKDFGRVRRDIGEDMKQRWESAGEEQRKELGKEYWRRVEEGRLEIVEEMKGQLLPHQIERLEQLSAQRMMREGKGRESAGLLSDQMISYLKIGDAQKKRIEEKSAKLKQEVTEKIQKILEEAKQELLSELDSGQKKKYEDLVGEPVVEGRSKEDRGNEDRKPGQRKKRR